MVMYYWSSEFTSHDNVILVFEVRKKLLWFWNFIKMRALIHKPWKVYVQIVFVDRRDYVLMSNKWWQIYVFAAEDMVHEIIWYA